MGSYSLHVCIEGEREDQGGGEGEGGPGREGGRMNPYWCFVSDQEVGICVSGALC